MAEARHRIHLAQGSLPRPAVPLEVDDTLRIVGGVGPQDMGARLIGFAPPGTESLKVSAVAAVADPASVIGLEPVLGKRGTFFSWGLAVEVLEYIEPTPEPDPEEPEVDEDQAFIAGELNG